MDCTICSHVRCNLRFQKSIVFGTEYIAGLLDNVVRFEQHRHTGSYLQSLLPRLHLRWKPRMLNPVQLVFQCSTTFQLEERLDLEFGSTLLSLRSYLLSFASLLSPKIVYILYCLSFLYFLSLSRPSCLTGNLVKSVRFVQILKFLSKFLILVKIVDIDKKSDVRKQICNLGKPVPIHRDNISGEDLFG